MQRLIRSLATRGRRQLSTASDQEVKMLQELLKKTQDRLAAEAAAKAPENAAAGPRFQVQTFNAISPVGLRPFRNARS